VTESSVDGVALRVTRAAPGEGSPLPMDSLVDVELLQPLANASANKATPSRVARPDSLVIMKTSPPAARTAAPIQSSWVRKGC